MRIRPFQTAETSEVISLWEACGLVVAHNDPRKDIERKMKVNPEMFLVGELEGRIVGTCMVGYEGHRGWINYLGVHPDFQRRGFASQLMTEAERILKQAGCPKINLQVRSTNREVMAFYEGIGYSLDDVVGFGRRLEED